MSIDQIKPLIVLAVIVIGLVRLLAAVRRTGATLKPATGAGRLDPGPLLERGASAPRSASAHGADWTREPNGAWQRIDDGALPPIEYPPGD